MQNDYPNERTLQSLIQFSKKTLADGPKLNKMESFEHSFLNILFKYIFQNKGFNIDLKQQSIIYFVLIEGA